MQSKVSMQSKGSAAFDPWESGVCVYFDNSNIFIEAQRLATSRNGNSVDESVRRRIRLDFDHLMELCCAKRKLVSALAAGSIPPELRHLWGQGRIRAGRRVSDNTREPEIYRMERYTFLSFDDRN